MKEADRLIDLDETAQGNSGRRKSSTCATETGAGQRVHGGGGDGGAGSMVDQKTWELGKDTGRGRSSAGG
jgi:hypothetical protein